METALLQAFRAATRKKNLRDGISPGTTDNVGSVEKPPINRETSSRNRQTLWRKRQLAGSRVHEGNQSE
jgi:hypothetical protein